MAHVCKYLEQQKEQGIADPKSPCKWRVVLFNETKQVVGERFFDSQEERQDFLELHPEWKKRGKRCPDRI